MDVFGYVWLCVGISVCECVGVCLSVCRCVGVSGCI